MIDETKSDLDLGNIQGNILKGYRGDLQFVRHIALEVKDRSAARSFLTRSVAGNDSSVPAITRATLWADRGPEICFNIGITFEGMRALGLPSAMLESFPTEFVEGMAKRSLKLGDFGESAAANWAAPFDGSNRLHIIATVYVKDRARLGRVQADIARAFNVLGERDGWARSDINVLGPAYANDGSPDSRVFFGYADSITQPRFEVPGYPDPPAYQPIAPYGTVLLGYQTPLEGVRFRVPMSDRLGRDGTFNSFRILAQDVQAFEVYLDEAAGLLMPLDKGGIWRVLPKGAEAEIPNPRGDRYGAIREFVAAQICGRWRNGTPVDLSPYKPYPCENPTPKQLQNFKYAGDSLCPAGAHIRRASPREGQIVQRAANYARQLVRRGMPYGPDFDLAKPDNAERGLLGSFIGASIGAQFEAVMCDWINLGLHNPDITRFNDPMIGANAPETSVFELRLFDGSNYRLRGFPRFVRTRGGAYTFLPSIKAIEHLAMLKG